MQLKGANPLRRKDLRKSPKKKCIEENAAVQNAKKNRTTKNCVGEELSKFPIKKLEIEKDTTKTVKMSRLCKAGQFFLR